MSDTTDKPCESVNILIVDDDLDILDALRDILEIKNSDYQITTANSIDQALQVAQQKRPPDLALIDIKVGQDNGLSLVPKLKQLIPDISCIMMTAFREAEYAVDAVKKGADDYLFKPINPENLFKTLDQHIEKQQVARKSSASDNRLKQVFEQVEHLLFVLDHEGITLEANETALKMPGASEESIIGTPFWLLPWWSNNTQNTLEIQKQLRNALSGQISSIEICDKSNSQNMHYYAIGMKPIFDPKNTISMIISEVRDITEEQGNRHKIETLAFHDPLTELANRRMFTNAFEESLINCQQHSSQSALLFLDLDHFKEINDQQGHQVGDKLLKQVARRLQAAIRQEDLVARLGGDEFVVLLNMIDKDPITASIKAEVVAEKIRQSLCMPYQLPSQSQQISSSIGIVIFPHMGQSLQELINAADTAMYHAKQSGRNQIALYDHRFIEKENNQQIVEQDIHIGLDNRQFELYFQPIYTIDGNLETLEALPRWHHPELGLILPHDFIPIAEQGEKILLICRWVLSEACRIIATHPEIDTHLSINISTQNFYHPHFTQEVLRVLESSGITVSRLILEINEKCLKINPELAIEHMMKLAERGVKFSIDDFGSGDISLKLLSKLPITQLKLDPMLNAAIKPDGDQRRFIELLVAMGRIINFRVIAKHVESDSQLQALKSTGCDGFQGYYLKQPAPIEQLLETAGQTPLTNAISRPAKNR